MAEFSSYRPGTPSWVDLGSPDLDASARFYGDLFGWEATEPGPVEETGGYRMFMLKDRSIAGMGPLQMEGQPPSWTTYISVENADETVAKVTGNGGQIIMPPMDVLDVGRMAIFSDSVGAVLAIWQPGTHHGAALANEPGTLCWNELACRDIDAAKRFYRTVFGWEGDTNPNPSSGSTYTEWKVEGRSVAGMIEMNEQWPAEIPSHWMPYFAVSDCDATAERATGLGGSVGVPPTTIPPGRFAVLSDPNGAHFSVIALSMEPPPPPS